MACHVMDASYTVPEARLPDQRDHATWRTTSCAVLARGRHGSASRRIKYNDSYPPASVVHYTFPARGKKLPPVKLHWYDGGILPERPEELEPDRRLPESGTIFVGDKGKMMCETYSESPRLIPEVADAGVQAPEEDDPARRGQPRAELDRRDPGQDEGDVELRLLRVRSPRPCCSATSARFPGQKLLWDGKALKVTNFADANEAVQHNYRAGWSL